MITGLSACDDYIEVPEMTRPTFYVDGVVDRNLGAEIVVVRTIANDVEYAESDAEASVVTDAEVEICGRSSGTCVPLSFDGRGRYMAAATALPADDSVAVRILVGTAVISRVGRLPQAADVAYDSLATDYLPPVPNRGSVREDGYRHRFAIRSREAGRVLVADIGGASDAFVDGRELELRADSEAACGANVFGRRAVFPGSCPADESIILDAYQDIRDAPVITVRISTSYDRDFPAFYEAIRQDLYTSYLSALADVLVAPSNVDGAGGFILFSASEEYDVRLR